MSSAADLAANEFAPIAEFLAQTLPFNELSSSELGQAVRALQIRYHAHGESFGQDTEPQGLRILRSGAVDLRDSSNKLLDRLGEGESFHIGGLNAEGGEVTATVIEDALIYLLPDAAYYALREGNRHFDRYFSGQRTRIAMKSALGSGLLLLLNLA